MQASTEGRGEVESVLALQRSAGNHAVTHLLLRLAAHGAPAARLLARGGNKGEALPVKPVIVGAIKGVPIKRYPPAGKPPGPQVHISTPAVEDLPEGTHGVSKNPPGSKTVKPSTEAGLFTHEHYERFADELRANAEKLTSEQLPAGLEREVRIPDTRLTFERRPKIDRLDRAAGEVIEIKPAHLKANGLAQAESYASLMNVHDPLPPPRKWKARVVTYDQQKVVTYVEDIGVLEVPKPHSTPQSKGAATKAKTPEKPSASAGERARTSSGWDPKSGPPENKLKKGPNFKPQPHEYDLGKPRVSSGSAAGFKALTKAKEEALRAEGSLVKGVRYGPAVGKAGRAAGAVADFLLPGPLDAIMAFAAVGQAYQENRANAKGKGLREGFARGLAARLVFSGSKARHLARVELAPRFVDASVEKQVAGVAGAEEKGSSWVSRRALTLVTAFRPSNGRTFCTPRFRTSPRRGTTGQRRTARRRRTRGTRARTCGTSQKLCDRR
jgi:hypothetical protein